MGQQRKKKKADPAEEANVKKVTEKWAGGRKRSHQWRPGLSGFQPLPEGDTFKTRARALEPHTDGLPLPNCVTARKSLFLSEPPDWSYSPVHKNVSSELKCM